jgi:curved DNA-binding protein CbpA
MPARSRDPYQTLGVSPGVSDEKLRSAYRRLVQLHHPDHNGGSAEAARRFEEVQEAYAQIKELRSTAPRAGTAPRSGQRGSGQAPPRTNVDPDAEARLAEMERELREAQLARERARQAAREAAGASARARRPSDEELGYVTTDDSFSKILDDARSELAGRLSDARERPVGRRVGDLIDELEGLVSKLTGEQPPHSSG